MTNSDGFPSDPPFFLTFYGAGAAVTPSSTTTTVFDSAGEEGYAATYNLNIGAGQTVRLMWILGMGDSEADSITQAGLADAINAQSSILAGLSSADLSSIQNYNFGGGGVPEPSTVLLSAAGLALVATRLRRQ